MIGGGVVIEVVELGRNHVKLGITAPKDVRVDREEVGKKRRGIVEDDREGYAMFG
jgi:carbon storage regulator CsrA